MVVRSFAAIPAYHRYSASNPVDLQLDDLTPDMRDTSLEALILTS